MPNPSEYESEKEFMAACVPKMMDEGKDNDQAVAACMSMWERKSVDLDEVKAEIEAKIGARNSRSDAERLQMIHDYSVENGAQCKQEPEVEMIPEKSLDEDTIVNFGGEVKSLQDGKIGGLLVRFSGPEDPDVSAQRDFFTANTDYGFKRGERKSTPVYFNHRMPIKTSDGREVWIKEQIVNVSYEGVGEITEIYMLGDDIGHTIEEFEEFIGPLTSPK